jgi:hypothetical protein
VPHETDVGGRGQGAKCWMEQAPLARSTADKSGRSWKAAGYQRNVNLGPWSFGQPGDAHILRLSNAALQTLHSRAQMPLTHAAKPRLLAGAAIVLVITGAAFTLRGWLALEPAASPISAHAGLFAGLWAAVAAIVFAASRWHRIAVLPAGFLLAGALALAFGQFSALVAVLCLGLASVALGRLLLSRWFPGASDLDCLLVGLAVYGTTIGLLAHYPVNYSGVYVALLAAPVLLGWGQAHSAVLRAWQWMLAPRRGSALQVVLKTATVAIALVYFLVALMPERGHDALVTHLMLPARIAWQHVWAFDVDTYVWAVMPMIGDWIYTIGYMLGGESGARLVNLGCLVVLARLVYEVAVWAGSREEGALWAVLLLLSTPLALAETSSLFVESIWSCFVVGGALALLRLMTGAKHSAVQLVVGGVLLGGALAAKAVTFMVLPVLALALAIGMRRWWRADLLRVIAAGGAAFLAIGTVPYVGAYLLTGNPVFPFFNGYFRSPHYALENFSAPGIFEKGMTWDVLYRITFESPKFLESRPCAAGFQWLLLIGPIAVLFLLARHRRGLVLLLIAFAIAWLTFAQTAYLRYVFPSFALAAAAAGMAIAGFQPVRSVSSRSLTVAAIATVALNILYFSSGGYQHQLRFRVLASDSAREEFLRDNLPLRTAVDVVNGLNQSHRPVAFFCKALATGLHADGLFPNWYNFRFQSQVNQAKTADELGAVLGTREAQFAILLDTWGSEPVRQRIRDVTREVLRIGNLSVRQLDPRFRFRTEMLQGADLSAPGVAEAGRWQLGEGARITPGEGALVRNGATIRQRTGIVAGREYRLTAVVQRRDAAAQARLQLQWIDDRDRVLRQEVEVFPCTENPEPHSMQHVAPDGAVAAVVLAFGQSGAPVVFRSLSLTN